jgi:hypothetical protein
MSASMVAPKGSSLNRLRRAISPLLAEIGNS